MAWSEEMIQKIWEKGEEVPGIPSKDYRKDTCGAWIGRKDYGNRKSEYGWEIDHISPGGPDILSNLHPLQWENNVDKSDGRLKCNIYAPASSTHNLQKR
ncbi:MAG: HNH endonuclease signature motif containing protein [Candidatus Eremiobacterota bacterium]